MEHHNLIQEILSTPPKDPRIKSATIISQDGTVTDISNYCTNVSEDGEFVLTVSTPRHRLIMMIHTSASMYVNLADGRIIRLDPQRTLPDTFEGRKLNAHFTPYAE